MSAQAERSAPSSIDVVGGSAGDPAGESQRHYFPALDGFRFLAFLIIFLHHVIGRDAFANPFLSRMRDNTWAGVDLFFVLSGFLISYLLFVEEDKRLAETGVARFSWGRFWIRRSLRIWPLYYVALLIGFIIIPNLPFLGIRPLVGDESYSFLVGQFALPSSLFFMNWTAISHGYPPSGLVTPLWSVCVEEQFYLLWPLTLMLVGRARRLPVMIAIFALAQLGKIPVALLGYDYLAIYLNTFLRADTVMTGAIVAHWMVRRGELPKVGRLGKVALFAMLVILSALPDIRERGVAEVLVGYVLIDVVSAGGLVLCLTAGTGMQRFFRMPVLVWLGRVSYGLYVYHILSIRVVSKLLLRFFDFGDHLLFYYSVRALLSLILCVGISAVSYYAFERWFLKLKLRYTVIESRPGG